ncbi:LORF2 protein, partial [Crocuta crocuta]
ILIFIAELFTIARLWKQPNCPSTDEWIKKVWCAMEYYSSIKKNEVLPFATTLMDLEDIMPSEMS